MMKEVSCVRSIFILHLLGYAFCQRTSDNQGVKCGGIYKGSKQGSISTPGFPDKNYPSNANCTYIIEAPANYVIAYESLTLDIEDPDQVTSLCVYDALNVYDGDNKVAEICGIHTIHLNATATNVLKFIFTSDYSTEAPGFEIKWKILDPFSRNIQFDCNFDDAIPLCAGWTHGLGDYQWHFTRGLTPSANTGPLTDHSTGTEEGRYAYIEASKAAENSTAILRSPPIARPGVYCLSFWYHMFGTGVGELAIELVESSGHSSVIDSMFGEKGEDWLNGQYIVTIAQPFATIVFVARRGDNYKSDIAIDDLSLATGFCSFDYPIDVTLPAVDVASTMSALPTFFNVLLTPRNCPTNMHGSPCPPGDCFLTCSNAGDLGDTALCSPACLGGCSCPNKLPVIHEGQCIEYRSCPQFTEVATTTIASTTAHPVTKKPKDVYDLIANKISLALQSVWSALKSAN